MCYIVLYAFFNYFCRNVNVLGYFFFFDFLKKTFHFNITTFNTFMMEVLIIKKPIHWCAQKIKGLLTIWYWPPSWKSFFIIFTSFSFLSIYSDNYDTNSFQSAIIYICSYWIILINIPLNVLTVFNKQSFRVIAISVSLSKLLISFVYFLCL